MLQVRYQLLVLLCTSLIGVFKLFFIYCLGDHVISYRCFRWSIEYCLLECIVVSETIGIICYALYLDDLCLLRHFAGCLMVNTGVTGSFHR